MVDHSLSLELEGPAIKAAKDDDTKVNARQWDEWSVNHFKSDSELPVKVCIPNSYCGEKHGRLFDELCALEVHWYRRKVLRSFLFYLRHQHGKGNSFMDSVVVGGERKTFKVSSWVRLQYRFRALSKSKNNRARDKLAAEFKKDLIVGSEAVWRTSQSSWWTWEAGSTLLFWR